MRICVYCSSSSAIDSIYNQVARDLGRLIGQRGHTLVYGGCEVGSMGHLARAAHEASGRVVGVITRRFLDGGLAFAQADEMLVTETLAERKTMMIERAEAFIALPGGLGTLDELSEVLALKQLGQVAGEVILLDVADFYVHLLAHLTMLYQRGFARGRQRQVYRVVHSAQEALDLLDAAQGGTGCNCS